MEIFDRALAAGVHHISKTSVITFHFSPLSVVYVTTSASCLVYE